MKILDQGNVNCATGHAMASAVQGAYRVTRIKYPAPKDIYKIKPRTKPEAGP